MQDNPWTEARMAELRSLVTERVPYGQIARQLGVSRSAAIGKASRLKICVSAEAAAEAQPAKAAASQRSGSPAIRGQQGPRPQAENQSLRPPHGFRCEPIPP